MTVTSIILALLLVASVIMNIVQFYNIRTNDKRLKEMAVKMLKEKNKEIEQLNRQIARSLRHDD